jgi:hypothetical protein
MPCPGQPLFGDQYRFCDVHSSDRVVHVYLSWNGGGLASPSRGNLGLWRKGENNDGTDVANHLWGTNYNFGLFAGKVDRGDMFTADPLGIDWERHRGKPLWELVNVHAGTTVYEEDPCEEWQVVLQTITFKALIDPVYWLLELVFVTGY